MFQKPRMKRNVKRSMTLNVRPFTTPFKNKNAKLVMRPNAKLCMKSTKIQNAALNTALSMRPSMKPNAILSMKRSARPSMRPNMKPLMSNSANKYQNKNALPSTNKSAKLATKQNTKKFVTNLNKIPMALLRPHLSVPPTLMDLPKPLPTLMVLLKLHLIHTVLQKLLL